MSAAVHRPLPAAALLLAGALSISAPLAAQPSGEVDELAERIAEHHLQDELTPAVRLAAAWLEREPDSATVQRESARATMRAGVVPDTGTLLGYALDAAASASAERALRRALALDPRDDEARSLLGQLLALDGRLDEAAKELEALASSFRPPARLMHDRALLAALEGRLGEAAALLEPLNVSRTRRHPRRPAALPATPGNCATRSPSPTPRST